MQIAVEKNQIASLSLKAEKQNEKNKQAHHEKGIGRKQLGVESNSTKGRSYLRLVKEIHDVQRGKARRASAVVEFRRTSDESPDHAPG